MVCMTFARQKNEHVGNNLPLNITMNYTPMITECFSFSACLTVGVLTILIIIPVTKFDCTDEVVMLLWLNHGP